MPFFAQAANITENVDSVFLFMLVICAAMLVLITALIIFFVVKYGRKRHPKGVDIEGHLGLEIVWTAIPLVIFLSMFYYGWTNFNVMRNPPRDAMVVDVYGRQWAWSFKYPNGKRTGELFVALDRPVKLLLHSEDVLHGFWIPAFRVKSDVVPGRTNFIWFKPQILGAFDIECTVMCGVHHTYMLSKVRVIPEEDFKKWYFAEERTESSQGPSPR